VVKQPGRAKQSIPAPYTVRTSASGKPDGFGNENALLEQALSVDETNVASTLPPAKAAFFQPVMAKLDDLFIKN
jgi:hypothetical protein